MMEQLAAPELARAAKPVQGPDFGRRLVEYSILRSMSVPAALILSAAGILKSSPATTHWYKMGVPKIMGAKPQRDDRIVHSGKIITAAGVSAGIDLALCWPAKHMRKAIEWRMRSYSMVSWIASACSRQVKSSR
jgi:transcriptional regulator GlxA family with amidase domain